MKRIVTATLFAALSVGCASLGGSGSPDTVLTKVSAAVDIAACVDDSLAKMRKRDEEAVLRAVEAQPKQPAPSAAQ